ncbi:MAG: mycofactocin-associated electron transfer flavoprotein alpha subunit [Mycobacteriales bacterium]
MIAVVVVRDGVLPLGGDEAVSEAGGRAVLVGSGTASAAAGLVATEVFAWEAGSYAPGAWAAALAPQLAHEDVVVLPGSPDGRDLAPRLAHVLARPLHAPAQSIEPGRVVVTRGGGLRTETFTPTGPYVATLEPGVRGAEDGDPVAPQAISLSGTAPDAVSTGVLDADPATMDLADATRIVAAGAGVGAPESADLLHEVATALGASYGATRVVTDLGWAPFERQIGTTGVVVRPAVYVAVGISGAVQHVSGIGQPDVVVAVNTDASCPMMAMADLAVVTDAAAFIRAMAERLGVDVPAPAGARA